MGLRISTHPGFKVLTRLASNFISAPFLFHKR
jgi:hypothetical protein